MCASRREEAVSRKTEAMADVTSLQIFSPFRERGESTQTHLTTLRSGLYGGKHERSDMKRIH